MTGPCPLVVDRRAHTIGRRITRPGGPRLFALAYTRLVETPPRATAASHLAAAVSSLRGTSHTGVLIGEGHLVLDANARASALLGLGEIPTEGIDWVGMTPREYRIADDQAIDDAMTFGASQWFRKEFTLPRGGRVTVDLIVVATETDPFRWIAFIREPGSSPLRRDPGGSKGRALSRYDSTEATFRLGRRLAGAGTMRQILTAVDRLALTAIGCDYVSVAFPTDDGTLRVHHDPGVDSTVKTHYREVACDTSTLAGTAYLSDTTTFIGIEEYCARYPAQAVDARTLNCAHFITAPMHADDGRVVGVLTTGWSEGADTIDLEHATSIADLLGNAFELATNTERNRSMAASFQDMLLPARLAHVKDAEVAVRYIAVDRAVGGDFYDVITSVDGTSWFVIGDVVGHGLPASRTMGKIRFFLRAVLRDESEPAGVLSRVHDLLLTEAMDELATCLIGRWDPGEGTLTIANAGHPPLVLADRSTTSRMAHATAPPLGTPGVACDPQTTVVDIAGPTRMLLYTDGLIERRDQIIDESIDSLVARFASLNNEPIERAADMIVDRATGSGDDDVALVLIHFSR